MKMNSLFPFTRGFREISCLIAALGVLGATSGCAPRYQIKTSNGHLITTHGKPKLNKEKNAYLYTDAEGKPQVISAGRVQEIGPR